jgi:hypothetical protein
MTLPPDGFYPHGINMWVYEFSFLLRWLELFRAAGMSGHWDRYPGLSAISRFRAAATSTDGLMGVTMGDPQYRVGGDSWCHALVAARTGSRQAQWLGDLLLELPVEHVDFRLAPARRRVYEHLWYDARVVAEESSSPVVVFPDGGQVFVRTGDSVFTFRSGYPLGEHRYRSGIPGAYGHGDPCQGSFLLAEQSSLVVAGPGPVYRRDSANHNIITVGGRGQVGDSTVWLPDFFPPDVVPPRAGFRMMGDEIAVRAETAPSYLPHLGVRSATRSLLISPGRFILGIDRVRLAQPAPVEWHLHTWGRFSEERGGIVSGWRMDMGSLRGAKLLLLEPLDAGYVVQFSDFMPAYPNDGTPDQVLTAARRSADVRFVWCLVVRDGYVPQILSPGPPELRFPDGRLASFDGTWITISGAP